jgi:4-amino-4-deoxy-L-arabinose transferase-like glycosyltransferase
MERCPGWTVPAGARAIAAPAQPLCDQVPLRAFCTRLTSRWSRQLFPAPDGDDVARGAWYWADTVLLSLVAALLLFPHLGYPLADPDEGRHAEVGREMLVGGDWLVPTLNRQPYYDKPPLFYWLLAGSFALFGTSAGVARLVPALAAFVTLHLIYRYGRRAIGSRAALLAALALALTPGFVLCGRFVIVDSVLTLWVTAALLAGHQALSGDQLRRGSWLASAVCCALGILTKGPVALALTVPPLVAFTWLSGVPARPRLRHWLAYTGLALGLAAPWYVAVLCREPGFAQAFFVEHHLHRFLGPEYHSQPVWYYLPVLFAGLLPWSLFLVPWGRFLLGRMPDLGALRPRALGLYLLWSGWCILFFSLSCGKLPAYVLPAAPGLALLFGCFLDRVLFQAGPAARLRPSCAKAQRLAALVLAGACLTASLVAWRLRLIGTLQAAVVVVLAAAGLVGLALCGRRLPARAAAALCLAILVVGLFQAVHEFIPAWAARRSPLASGEVRQLLRDRALPVACFGGDWGSVPFYARSTEAVPSFGGAADAPQMQRYLAQHPRCLFVIRHAQDRAPFQVAVPAGMKVTTVAAPGEAVACLVQPGPQTQARLGR